MYKTNNLYLATYLLAKGYSQYSIEKNGRQVTFVFDYPLDKMVEEENAYWQEKGLVSAKKLFMSDKELKTRLSSSYMYVYDHKGKYTPA